MYLSFHWTIQDAFSDLIANLQYRAAESKHFKVCFASKISPVRTDDRVCVCESPLKGLSTKDKQFMLKVQWLKIYVAAERVPQKKARAACTFPFIGPSRMPFLISVLTCNVEPQSQSTSKHALPQTIARYSQMIECVCGKGRIQSACSNSMSLVSKVLTGRGLALDDDAAGLKLAETASIPLGVTLLLGCGVALRLTVLPTALTSSNRLRNTSQLTHQHCRP